MTDHPAQIAALLKDHPYGVHVGLKLSDDYKVIAEQELDSGRWSRFDLMVIEGPVGSLWGVEQETGLTEYQETDNPFGYEDPIPVFKVKTVPTIRYEKES